jgi:hypothetical protein
LEESIHRGGSTTDEATRLRALVDKDPDAGVLRETIGYAAGVSRKNGKFLVRPGRPIESLPASRGTRIRVRLSRGPTASVAPRRARQHVAPRPARTAKRINHVRVR